MNIPDVMYGAHGSGREEAAIETAFKAGFVAFDSATISSFGYGEENLGAVLAKINTDRNKLWLQTKFTPNMENYGSIAHNFNIPLAQQVQQSFDWSLSTLHTNYLNSYIIHSAATSYGSLVSKDWQIWHEMESIYRKGQVDYLGFSNLSLHALKALVKDSSIKPSFIQNDGFLSESYSDAAAILKYCLENAIIYQVFSLIRQKELINNPSIELIAQNHSVSKAQVIFNFAIEMGMLPLTGGSTEQHIKENANLNFKLAPEEIREIINLTSDKEQFLSIYSQLQDGSLVTLKNIVQNISNCEIEQLPVLLNKIGHYIAKLNPSSLTEIISAQNPIIIDYLKQYKADFTEINSKACAKMVEAHGISFINVLKNQLNIPAEKLLLASLADDNYFNKLFLEADLNTLSPFDITKIINLYPELIDSLPISKDLLVAVSSLGYKQHFKNLLDKVDLSQLTNSDLIKLIINEGREIITALHSANFAQLTEADFKILLSLYGSEFLKEIPNINSAIIVSDIIAVDLINLFAEFNDMSDLSQEELSKLDNFMIANKLSEEQVKNILEQHHSLILKETSNDLETLREIVETADFSNMSNSQAGRLLEELSAVGALDLRDKVLGAVDLSKFNYWDIKPLLIQDIEIVNYLLQRNVLADVLIEAASNIKLETLKSMITNLDLSIIGDYTIYQMLKQHSGEIIAPLKTAGAKIDQLSSYYIEEIIKARPDIIDALIEAEIPNKNFAWLLEFASNLKDHKYFDYLFKAVKWQEIYGLETIIKNKAKQLDVFLDKNLYNKLASEINYHTAHEHKKDAFGDLLDCFADKACISECLMPDLNSHLECYGKFHDIREEL